MPSSKTTTVVLSKKAQEIKDRLAPAFGLKNILCVGLELFDALPDNEKIKRTAEVNKASAVDQQADELVSAAEADAVKKKQSQRRRPSKSAG